MTYKEIHLAFINQFNIGDQRYKSLIINEDIVKFFTHVKIQNQSDVDKQIQVVLSYSDTVLEEAQNSSAVSLDKQKRQLIEKLVDIRIECQTFQQSPQKK